jgi:hypothetical protein
VKRLEKPIRGTTDRAMDCYVEARWQIDQAYLAKNVGRKREVRSHVKNARWWVRRSRAADRRAQ